MTSPKQRAKNRRDLARFRNQGRDAMATCHRCKRSLRTSGFPQSVTGVPLLEFACNECCRAPKAITPAAEKRNDRRKRVEADWNTRARLGRIRSSGTAKYKPQSQKTFDSMKAKDARAKAYPKPSQKTPFPTNTPKSKSAPSVRFVHYNDYINSITWKNFKLRYYADHPRRCSACGVDGQVDLHHMTYERIGREWDDDVVPLCRHCHYAVHTQHRSSNGSLMAVTKKYIKDFKASAAA